MNTFKTTLGVAILLWASALTSAQEKYSVYVGVSMDDTSKSKARELSDSARDLREQIGRRSNLVLADHPEAAEILITVLDRQIVVGTSGQTNYGGGNTQSHYQSRYILKYRLESGSFSQDAEYVLAGAFVTWKRMASGISKDIERWVDENSKLAERGREAQP
jgi:hypothetical protein